MENRRTGYTYFDKSRNRWVARTTVKDQTGKCRNVKKYCGTKGEARRALLKLLEKIDERGDQAIDGDRMTFNQVADRYAELRIQPARYVNDVKVAGLRSKGPNYYLPVLRDYFGLRRLKSITHADIEAFKLKRLATPVIRGKGDTQKITQRSVAAVNRELELLRTIFNHARRQGWIQRSPFEQGERLIQRTGERIRDRVLSRDEERKLLACCVEPREHLLPIVLLALDCGLRRGEILALQWQDLDHLRGLITLRAITTKTAKSRTVALTDRLAIALKAWRGDEPRGSGGLVFDGLGDFKRSFSTALRLAGIRDFRFHDLRHTAVTRMIEAGISPAEAMKISGHSTLSMLSRYLNTTVSTAKRVAGALDHLIANNANDSEAIDDPASSLIN